MDEGAPQAAAATTFEDYALDGLRHGWGDAYEIERDAAGGFRAKRRDGLGGAITSDDPEAMATEIYADYSLKPVPRDLPAGSAP